MRVLAFFLAAIIGVLPLLETRDLHAASEAEAAAARIPLENYPARYVALSTEPAFPLQRAQLKSTNVRVF